MRVNNAILGQLSDSASESASSGATGALATDGALALRDSVGPDVDDNADKDVFVTREQRRLRCKCDVRARTISVK